MAAAKILFCIVCFALIGSSWMPDRNMLKKDVVAIAAQDVGVREATGKNDGKRVEAYLAYVGLKKGDPWCAAWVSFVFWKAGYAVPKTGWSPDLFPDSRLVKVAGRNTVFGIYFANLKRIAHCGFVEQVHHDYIYTIEGNTNLDGSRDGVGVFRRIRHNRNIRKFANWVKGDEK